MAQERILVVDDEPHVIRVLKLCLTREGHEVECVGDGSAALAVIRARPPDYVITDIQMPGSIDGLKLAHAVHHRWPSIKIILVSGQVKVSDADTPADSRFFGKPLEVKRMIAELQAMVGVGALKILPEAAISLAVEELAKTTHKTLPPRSAAQEFLTAENDSLRLLLEQAVIDAKALLAQAGIDAKEREAADKLQKLILEEMHHRIKNTLATVAAIASQSLRTATSIEHGEQAIAGRLIALGRAHDLLLQRFRRFAAPRRHAQRGAQLRREFVVLSLARVGELRAQCGVVEAREPRLGDFQADAGAGACRRVLGQERRPARLLHPGGGPRSRLCPGLGRSGRRLHDVRLLGLQARLRGDAPRLAGRPPRRARRHRAGLSASPRRKPPGWCRRRWRLPAVCPCAGIFPIGWTNLAACRS